MSTEQEDNYRRHAAEVTDLIEEVSRSFRIVLNDLDELLGTLAETASRLAAYEDFPGAVR